ncbi:MmcQ/YjbR family DNA-binding protein [Brevibacterium linens]|uniref:MmcQ/YjbR family DNA-binding protein n=1 Tax=Brevibacterium linens TaxID=1703 RepID=UPI0035166CBE
MLDPMDAEVVLERPDSFVPVYLGASGWVGLALDDLDDEELRELIIDSYRSTASTRLSKTLGIEE